MNSVQEFLWDQWNAMRDLVVSKYGRVDRVIVNGDSVDGVNKFEEGIGIVTPDLMEQCEIVKELLHMIPSDGYVFFNGSDYHVKQNPSCDQIACQMTGGVWKGFQSVLGFDNIKMHVRHYAPYSKKKSRRCASQREEAYEMEHDGWDVDLFIRSHTHSFDYSGNSQNLTINTPCWKGRDRYIEKRGMSKSDIGYIILNIDGNNYSWDQMVMSVPEQLYSY